MFDSLFQRVAFKRALSFAVMLMLQQAVIQKFGIGACQAETTQLAVTDDPAHQFANLTKKILLSGIELERFSLNFRMENAYQSKFRNLRYFLSQETGASCGLVFEAIGDDQFGRGRHRPLRISQQTLRGALTTVMTGSIIAGSGSCLELGINVLQSIKNYRHGLDPRAANRFVASKLKEIDQLLAQREALVAAHRDDPAFERAVVEGKILSQLRNAFVDEYSHFNADTRSYAAFQDFFFLLNASYSTVNAVGAAVARKAVSEPRLNGPANVLFTVGGGMASVSPLLSAAVAALVRKHAYDSVDKAVGARPKFDAADLAAQCKKLDDLAPVGNGSLIPALPSTERLAIYMQSDNLFRKQLDSETVTMRKLNKVALETSLLGPLIGGQLMTQGILGDVGYYKYTVKPRKQVTRYFAGSVVGTVGIGMSVVGNAAWLLSSMSYEHRLSKEKRLPAQLIKERLEHLDDLDKAVNAI